MGEGLYRRLADRGRDGLPGHADGAPLHRPRREPHRRCGLMLSALLIARAIESGEFTPTQAIDLCANAIAEREKDVGAFVTLDLEGVRKAALAPGLKDRPLRGLPVALKDIFDTADMPTEYGSPIYAGHRPRADAAVVVQIAQAG